MHLFWMNYLPLWAPEGEGDGGGGSGDADGASDKGASGGEGVDGGEGGDKGGDGDAGKQRSSILDMATGGGDKPGDKPGADWKLPDTIKLPDHLVGTSAEDTLAKVTKAYTGARSELATKGTAEGKLEGQVPDKLEEYSAKWEPTGDGDRVAAELNAEESKPFVDAFREAGHKLGIPDATFQKLMRDGLAKIAETGLPIGQTPEEVQQLSADAELAALSKMYSPRDAQVMVNTVESYGQKLLEKGTFTKTDLAEFRVAVGTAGSTAAFYKLMTAELGEKPIPPGDPAASELTATEAHAAYAAALKLPEGAERTQAMEEASRKMNKAYAGQESTGSVRSQVL